MELPPDGLLRRSHYEFARANRLFKCSQSVAIFPDVSELGCFLAHIDTNMMFRILERVPTEWLKIVEVHGQPQSPPPLACLVDRFRVAVAVAGDRYGTHARHDDFSFKNQTSDSSPQSSRLPPNELFYVFQPSLVVSFVPMSSTFCGVFIPPVPSADASTKMLETPRNQHRVSDRP